MFRKTVYFRFRDQWDEKNSVLHDTLVESLQEWANLLQEAQHNRGCPIT
jgi:hypothetical protein